jgi:hypothetical protein
MSFGKNLVSVALMFLASCSQGNGPPLVVHGDSTAIASRIPKLEKFWNVYPPMDRERWWNILASSYTPHRPIYNDGVRGQSVAAMRDRIVAYKADANATTIIYDRLNGDEETFRSYTNALAEAISALHTTHFLIVPQVMNAEKADKVGNIIMPEINEWVQRRYPNNTFSVSYRNSFLMELSLPNTRADGLHRNAKGQAIEARYIKYWLDRHGW